jgi:hypothetical protein
MAIHQEVVNAVLGSRPDLCPLTENFSKNFDVTWARDRRLHGMDIIAFFIRPKRFVSEMFGFEKEILLIFPAHATR